MSTELRVSDSLCSRRMKSDRVQGSIGVFLLIAITALLTQNDFRTFGIEPSYTFAYIVRTVYIVLGMLLIIPTIRAQSIRSLEFWICLDLLLFMFASFLVNWSKVPYSSENLVLSAAAIIVFFTLFPIRLRLQLFLSGIMVLGGIIVLVTRSEYFTARDYRFFLIAYAGALFTGVVVSLGFHRSRQYEFEALVSNERTREALDLERDKVKILQGLLPVCAQCRRVVDEHGVWIQMETYIRAHSKVDFTHGYCPPCAEEVLTSLQTEN